MKSFWCPKCEENGVHSYLHISGGEPNSGELRIHCYECGITSQFCKSIEEACVDFDREYRTCLKRKEKA